MPMLRTYEDQRIIREALRWWRSLRPIGWKEREHLKTPTVNCRAEQESPLALACAVYLRAKNRRRSSTKGASK